MARIFEKNYLDIYLRKQSEGGWGVGDWVSDTVITEKRPYTTQEIYAAIQDSDLDATVKNAFLNREAVVYLVNVMQTGVWGTSSPKEFDTNGDNISSYIRPALPVAYAGENQLDVAGTQVTLDANEPDTSQGQAGYWLVRPNASHSTDWYLFGDRNAAKTTFNGDAGTSYILIWALTKGDGITLASADIVRVSFQSA